MTSFDVDASPISNEPASDSLETIPFKKSSEVVDNLPAASEHRSDAGLILIVTAASQADAAVVLP